MEITQFLFVGRKKLERTRWRASPYFFDLFWTSLLESGSLPFSLHFLKCFCQFLPACQICSLLEYRKGVQKGVQRPCISGMFLMTFSLSCTHLEDTSPCRLWPGVATQLNTLLSKKFLIIGFSDLDSVRCCTSRDCFSGNLPKQNANTIH